jgi:hypothetical protein
MLDFSIPLVVNQRSDSSREESESGSNDDDSFHPTKSWKPETSLGSRQVTARGHQSGCPAPNCKLPWKNRRSLVV